MNCRNCGGAMELFATRGYFFCRYCGSFHFPETATTEGVRVLGEVDGAPACPACARTLAAAVLDETHSAHYCRNCRGVLLSRGTFVDVVRLRRAWATGTPAQPVPIDRKELARALNCPRCARRMETHPYYGPGNVVIDSCGSCDVIWLDFGELKQIVDAPGRDRGGQERAAAAREDWTPDPTSGRMLMNRGDTERTSRRVDLLSLMSDLLDG
jgi:Zn-finger nucleic acid-binding protein